MKFLLDTSPKQMAEKGDHPLVGGQLLTPLTRYADWGKTYAIDNGAFSGFPREAFASLLQRQADHIDRCLWVSCPDIVGNGRRTLEIWHYRRRFFPGKWIGKAALVAQDGMEDLLICWENVHCLFVGGKDPWKDSQAAADIVRTAITLGIPTHAGRVNTLKRYKHFAEMGVDTCDGSGVVKYSHMLKAIVAGLDRKPDPELFPENPV